MHTRVSRLCNAEIILEIAQSGRQNHDEFIVYQSAAVLLQFLSLLHRLASFPQPLESSLTGMKVLKVCVCRRAFAKKVIVIMDLAPTCAWIVHWCKSGTADKEN
eukprot:1137338-Pelagomonas_calceolata.AAC.3